VFFGLAEGSFTNAELKQYLDKVTARMSELAAAEHPALVAGDVNIAHQNVDIANWKGNLKNAGFLPEERAYLDRWLDELGWTDLGREHGGEGPGPFTWWSWRGQSYLNDRGWRIDYQLANPSLAPRAVKVEVDRAPTYESRWSDHAPVVATYDV
jgi:exodeoxyribonuclease-3